MTVFEATRLLGVVAVYGLLNVSCSSDGSFTTTDGVKPSRPTGLGATAASDTEVNLIWSASSDNTSGVAGLQGYRIFRDGTFVKATGNVTTATDAGLTASTEYIYAIEAFDGNGNISDRSDEATVTTDAPPPDTAAPVAASGVAPVESGATQITVTWMAASDNVGVTQNEVLRSAGGAGSVVVATIAGNAASYTDDDVNAGTTYAYTIRSSDAAGNSASSATSSALTTGPIATAPGAPAGAPTSSNSVWFSWTPAVDNVGGSGIKSYQIRRNGLTIATVAGDVTNFTESDLVPGSNYSYTIAAFDYGGHSLAGNASANIRTNNSDTNPGDGQKALDYALIASGGINNTGTSIASQDIAISSSGGIFPGGLSTSGAVHVGDAEAKATDNSRAAILGIIGGLADDRSVPGPVNTAITVDPGVTNLNALAAVDGTITLDAHGNADALFIVKITGPVTINQNIGVSNSAAANRVYIQCNSDITIAPNVTISGNIITFGNIALGTGASVTGRIMSGGTISLDNNVIVRP